MLTLEAQREIEAAFAAARAKTRAPLQCVLAQSSADYALPPVLAAAGLALAAPWPLLWLTTLAAERIYLIQLALFLLLLAGIAFTPVRVALATAAHKRSAGHRAALTQFALRGLDRAPERNGLLLYVSLGERYARIVADVGFDGKVSSAEWRAAIDELSAAMGRGEREAALKSAAASLGAVLARHFPPAEGGAGPKGEGFHVVR
jgi:putative membrane protein